LLPASHLRINDLVSPQPRRKLVAADERFRSFVVSVTDDCAVLNFGLSHGNARA
jgi:hypothetical protein